ncbi:9cd76d5d-f288-4319-8f53-349f9485f88d [Sclerotinia trifoliorum]|uniref:RING-type E3 ubiquitin transferase n=1 Tax=Sclerotinia trifoliorum TaxID=28548 RepID=A0A8H2W5I2_9HELO|nr:9cd76d5d-f288-4319-8f53-349f9485f88d [Sclerotinia trifoliorum]
MSDDDCSICLLAPVSERCGREVGDCKICDQSVSWKGRVEPCGHEVFHHCCIEGWLDKGERTCPICRGNIIGIRHNFSQDGNHSKYRKLAELEPRRVVLFLAHGVQRALLIPQQNVRRRISVYLTKSFSIPIISFIRRRVTPQDIANSSDMEARVRLFAEHEIQIFSAKCVCPACQEPTSSSSIHMIVPSEVEVIRNFVVNKIVDLLKRYDLQDKAVEIEQEAEQYLNEHARLFLHELRAWIESPFDTLEQWHRNARYLNDSFLTSIEDNYPLVYSPSRRPNLIRRNAGLQRG